MPTKMKFVGCRLSPGFFDSEFYVMLGETSAFVDKSNVTVERAPEQARQVEGQVLVYLVGEETDRALVELPGQAVVGGLRTWIPKDTVASV